MRSSIATSSCASAVSPIATRCWDASAAMMSCTISRTQSGSGSDLVIERRHVGAEAAEDDVIDAARMRLDLAYGDLGSRLLGIAVNAGRDRREGDAFEAVSIGQCQ